MPKLNAGPRGDAAESGWAVDAVETRIRFKTAKLLDGATVSNVEVRVADGPDQSMKDWVV
jgi:hypothetical protein